ncbi:uncharacterized protein LOC143201907 isoform X1 [Rhynchophorus ferrugineus]|uniref:uncharacterized protein LOC143201907 isoform X1 n=1 Tax=Rhynchophorus ferrugineus TaxID=354439 RepID=UPI003FCDC7A8
MSGSTGNKNKPFWGNNILAVDKNQNPLSVEVSTTKEFNIDQLACINPHFVSVTWLGNKYLELPNLEAPAILLAQKLIEADLPVVLHLPGRNLSKDRLYEILSILKEKGIRYILAIQGDWAHTVEKEDSKCDFPYASDLVLFIKDNFADQFCVGVAAYPNLHMRCQSLEEDLKYLKQKIDNGAEFIITQAVFDYESLEKYALACREAGIEVPIFPGIFFIKSHKSLVNMAKWCEFKVPGEILSFVEANKDDAGLIRNYGLDLGNRLIRRILARGDLFAGVHIFSMNDVNFVELVAQEYKTSEKFDVDCQLE